MNKSVIAAIAIMIALPATLSARSFTRSLTVNGSFSSLKTDGNIEVEYTAAPQFSAVIKAEHKTDLDKVKATLSGGRLTITTTGKTEGDIKVELSSLGVDTFEATGNSGLELEGNVSGKIITLNTGGNASIEAENGLNAATINLTSTGNSHIKVDGSALATQIKANTKLNSHVRISSLEADGVQINTDGNSHFSCQNVNATNLGVETGDNSIVSLRGKAALVDYSSNGNSSIKAGMLKAKGGKASSGGNSHITAAVRGLQQSSTGNSSVSNNY
ncbi:MAG: DUF2807 domain-containing protein [Muribaculaceae bacterium]|nr:DUF2807 domain-containing protein [Muribaculaceae bacterium]